MYSLWTRYDCTEKLEGGKADFEALDPEDMYNVAVFGKDHFDVVKEIRTKEEPDGNFFLKKCLNYFVSERFSVWSTPTLRSFLLSAN